MKPTLGAHELKVLTFIADQAPVTVKQVYDTLGVSEGLAKTTVQTMMERLRRKGFLYRTKPKGGSQYEYSPATAKNDLLRQLVRDFVEQTLGGAFAPMLAYLVESRGLTESEVALLDNIVQRMENAEQAEKTKETHPDA